VPVSGCLGVLSAFEEHYQVSGCGLCVNRHSLCLAISCLSALLRNTSFLHIARIWGGVWFEILRSNIYLLVQEQILYPFWQ
jgi:hypothetical protein